MKITPLDIQRMEFRVRLRGYDREEVDQFLEEVAQTVESLASENSSLRAKLSAAEHDLGELKKAEATLTQTLVSTQALTDQLKQAAQRDADLVVKEAEFKAEEVLREAREELARSQRDLIELRKQRLLAIERLRSMLRSFERMLEIEEGVEEAADPVARPDKIAER
jgi:cell division initiation protein